MEFPLHSAESLPVLVASSDKVLSLVVGAGVSLSVCDKGLVGAGVSISDRLVEVVAEGEVLLPEAATGGVVLLPDMVITKTKHKIQIITMY